MSCDARTQQGWLELAGPIQPSELAGIGEKSHFPLTFSFSARTTPPTLVNGTPYVEESPLHTCTYSQKNYSLVDVRFAPPLHKGFILPGDRGTPQAECILAYFRQGDPIPGILLCFPLFVSGEPAYSEYIEQLVRPPDPSSNTPIHGLDRLLYKSDGSTTHTILSYSPCVELLQPSATLQLRVYVFSKGVHLTPTVFELLRERIRPSIRPYGIPPVIRQFQPTLLRYQLVEGNKKVLETSAEGQLYTTTVSTCTSEFKRLVEYLHLPPRPRAAALSAGGAGTKQYTTEQYKCVPFHSLTDLSGNLVIPGNTTLQEVLDKKKEQESGAQGPQPSTPASGLSSGELEAIVGGSIGGFLLITVAIVAVTRLFTRPQ